MRKSALVAAALLAVVVVFGNARAASAAPVRCEYDEDAHDYVCRGAVSESPEGSVDELIGDSPIRWRRTPLARPTCQRTVAVPIDPANPPPGVPAGVTEYELTENGVVYLVQVENSATGAFIDAANVCVFPCVGNSQPGPGAACSPPEPPPPPPGFEHLRLAIEDAVDLSPSQSPTAAIGGLTGLETWLWCQQPGPITPEVELNGWHAQVNAGLAQVVWALEGPSAASTTSPDCGSEAEPAATWTPETMGAHSISLTATYRGTWTLSGEIVVVPGVVITIPPQTFPLADAVIPGEPIAYPVDEQIGVLTG